MVNRKLSAEELNAIRLMLACEPEDDRKRLVESACSARVKNLNENGSILEFVHSGYTRPNQRQKPVGQEGLIDDADGSIIEVILYWDQNRVISELEMIKISESNDLMIDWSTFRIAES